MQLNIPAGSRECLLAAATMQASQLVDFLRWRKLRGRLPRMIDAPAGA